MVTTKANTEEDKQGNELEMKAIFFKIRLKTIIACMANIYLCP